MREFDKSLIIYILTCDRTDLLRETLESFIAASIPTSLFIVSDNSKSDETKKHMEINYPNVNYIKCVPNLLAIDHFNKILNEVKSDYLMMFHDDDLILPGMIKRCLEELKIRPELSAIATNAYIIKGLKKTSDYFFKSTGHLTKISNSEMLALRYMQLTEIGTAPFPSYIYAVKKIRNIRLNSDLGGKYCDVAFLLEVVKRGPIVWINDPLMFYREHLGSDSKSFDFRSSLKLLRHLRSTQRGINSNYFQKYRLKLWLSRLLTENNIKKRERFKIIFYCVNEVIRLGVSDKSIFYFILKKMIVNIYRRLSK
jgi:glycosyltransferase involved in cell wall biosynthesis